MKEKLIAIGQIFMHSTKYEKLDYLSIPVFKSIRVFPRWQTNSLGVTNEKALSLDLNLNLD